MARQDPVLILLRHGHSLWNQENRFTGWVDIDLSPQGVKECRAVASKLVNTEVHVAYTSCLKRAWRSLQIILEDLDMWIPVVRTAALDERHYGQLQGMNKDEARQRFGVQQVEKWRRSFWERPPGGESLADTFDRVIPFFQLEIRRDLERGFNVLLVAHGNSLRALIKYFDGLSDEEIMSLEIPFGEPIFYRKEGDRLIRWRPPSS